MSVLDHYKDEHLSAYADLCCKYAKIDRAKFITLVQQALAYYKQPASLRKILRPYQELENRWYDSFRKSGKPDYSVYADPYMLVEVWACWVLYSRGYLKLIDKPKMTCAGSLRGSIDGIQSLRESLRDSVGAIQSIGDLGCGCGYTTAALREAYPAAKVYGTQILNSAQFDIAAYNGLLHGFKVLPRLNRHVDLVFASEYFEHHAEPVEHLEEVISVGSPSVLIIANSFGARSVGHFDKYCHRGKSFEPRLISRLFNRTLRDHGYASLVTRFWNNRPTVWVKKKENG